MLYEIAGRMGMSENEFDLITPRYFYFLHKGFESVRLEDAKSARIIAFFAYLGHTKRGSLRRPEDLYPLPGDKTTLERIEDSFKDDRDEVAKVLKIAKNIDFFAGEVMPALPEA